MAIALLSQFDKRWSGVRLGTTKNTVGRVGCYITAVCIGASKFYKNHITPDKAARLFRFTADAMFVPDKSDLAKNAGLKFIKKVSSWNKAEAIKYCSTIDHFVVIQVNSGAHFVYMYGWNYEKKSPMIIDPAGGARHFSLPSKYRATGLRIYKKA